MSHMELTDEDLLARDPALTNGLADLRLISVVPRRVDVAAWTLGNDTCVSVKKAAYR